MAEVRWGLNTHLPSAVLLDLVVQAGFGSIRVDFNWFMMEPERGRYDWAVTDEVVDGAKMRGLDIYATLAYTPAWANGGQAKNTPPQIAADWHLFVSTVVRRYQDSIKHWGLWNEPNMKSFWSGSPAQYVNLILEPGFHAVKGSDRAAKVCGPELAMERDWAQWLTTILAHGRPFIDIVTHHCYQDTTDEVLRRVVGPLPWWERLWKGPTVREVMERTATQDRPLWLTEVGWTTSDISAEQQAHHYDVMLERLQTQARIDRVFFYELRDHPPEGWGLVDAQLQPKLAYQVSQRRLQRVG